jgi:antiviral helicase SKI2
MFNFLFCAFKPPALPKERPEMIRKQIEDKYLVPALNHEEDSVENCGMSWDFEWLGESLPLLGPSLPRASVMPVWEPPFRRVKKHHQNAMDNLLDWIPGF